MAQELINLGALADDGTGDTIRATGIKINNNFIELYALPFAQTSLGLVENEISTTQSKRRHSAENHPGNGCHTVSSDQD